MPHFVGAPAGTQSSHPTANEGFAAAPCLVSPVWFLPALSALRAVRAPPPPPGQMETGQAAVLHIDLKPSVKADALAARLARPALRKSSLSSKLRKAARLPPVAVGLIRHAAQADPAELRDGALLAAAIKRVPLALGPHQGWADAISTSGGVSARSFASAAPSAAGTRGAPSLMLEALPGVFVAGEMLDWEAPTGGYLLTGCFSTAFAAAEQMLDWMQTRQ